MRRRTVMPLLEVKCTVSSCFFHKKDNLCGAEKIEINMDEQAQKKYSSEFATDFDLKAAPQKAIHSKDTCCNTFKPKEI